MQPATQTPAMPALNSGLCFPFLENSKVSVSAWKTDRHLFLCPSSRGHADQSSTPACTAAHLLDGCPGRGPEPGRWPPQLGLLFQTSGGKTSCCIGHRCLGCDWRLESRYGDERDSGHFMPLLCYICRSCPGGNKGKNGIVT